MTIKQKKDFLIGDIVVLDLMQLKNTVKEFDEALGLFPLMVKQIRNTASFTVEAINQDDVTIAIKTFIGRVSVEQHSYSYPLSLIVKVDDDLDFANYCFELEMAKRDWLTWEWIEQKITKDAFF